MHDLLLRALRCEEVERPPVWLMRQAGRYMPEYQVLRKKHSLWNLFHDPQLAVAVTLQPIERLGVDAAILFSDILVIVEALGFTLSFPEGKGPCIEPPLTSLSQLEALPKKPVREALSYVFETIRLLKKQLTVPLIGFSGAPFTVASYLIDSTSKQAFVKTKQWMREDPTSFHLLLQQLTDLTIDYLQNQVLAGVDALQVFDSWANVLNDEEFALFSLPYLKQIVDSVQTPSMPVILFCRSSSLRATSLASIHPRCISCDWHLPIDHLREQIPEKLAIQGNFSPDLLKAPLKEIELEVTSALKKMQGKRGWIVNLGHGITPDIPVDHVRHFVDLVKSQ